LAVPAFLETIEQTRVSEWLRESESVFGFYFVLLFHTFGLSLLVGASAVLDLRILGVAVDLPLESLKWLFRTIWIGFAINVTTGILLVLAYPTKAFTNPVFYIKLSLVAIGLITMQKIKTRVFDDPALGEAAMAGKARSMAICSLLVWTGALTAGRLLAYTAPYLVYGVRGG
jgi:hypothetical protein